MSHATIQSSEFRHTYQVSEDDLNQYGMMHGGRLLTLCDEVGYVSASMHAGADCLTRAVHQARFHRPMMEGDHLCIRARVGLTGYSSLWVAVDVICDERCMMDAVFVFAAIDEHRNVLRVPVITVGNHDEKKLQSRLKRMRSQLLGEAD